jgi:hypothetical protein
MGLLDDDDGKGKGLDLRHGRHLALTVAFAVGVCAGVVAAERLYLATNRADILAGVSAMGGGGADASPASAAGGAAGGVLPAPLEPDALEKSAELRELRAYLEKIAPEGEVMIGVSNQNPMLEGMLDTWLEGVRGAGVRFWGKGARGRVGAGGPARAVGAAGAQLLAVPAPLHRSHSTPTSCCPRHPHHPAR